MHIRWPSVYKWLTLCQMPGGWPVQQSVLPKSLRSIFFPPIQVISIPRRHRERFVLHIVSKYFTSDDSAADHWSKFWAAFNQFRSPKYVLASSRLFGGRPLFPDGAEGKLCTKASKRSCAPNHSIGSNLRCQTVLVYKIFIATRLQWV